MYKMQLVITNPVTGESVTMVYQFDPPSLTQAKWSGAYTAVKAKLDELTTASAVPGKEPAIW